MSKVHCPWLPVFTADGSFPRLSHMSTLFLVTFLPVCHWVQSAASFGVQVMVCPCSSSTLDCLSAETDQVLPQAGHVTIWSSATPGISVLHAGLRQCPWMILSSGGVIRSLTRR